MKKERHFVVLGGAGTIGKVVVRDLLESHPDNQILIADYNEAAAKTIAQSLNNSRVKAAFADARDINSLAKLLRGQRVAINCIQHNFNLNVMEAALLADTHYVDLGGLFSWTRKQLRLNKRFQDVGLIAVIGMGCSPGITNILAAYAASLLDQVRSIKIRVGSKDFNPPASGLWFPYSAQTIVEELTLKPWIFRAGKFRQISPRTGWESTIFPEPLGNVWTLWTRHSEIATLPISFKDRGLKYCDFKVSFDREFVKEVMRRLRIGCTIVEFNKLMVPASTPNDYEISRVTVDKIVMECHAKAKPEWKASAGDVDTACPPSIVAQMIVEGNIRLPGVLPPEIAVPVLPFLVELEKRGMEIKASRMPD